MRIHKDTSADYEAAVEMEERIEENAKADREAAEWREMLELQDREERAFEKRTMEREAMEEAMERDFEEREWAELCYRVGIQ